MISQSAASNRYFKWSDAQSIKSNEMKFFAPECSLLK